MSMLPPEMDMLLMTCMAPACTQTLNLSEAQDEPVLRVTGRPPEPGDMTTGAGYESEMMNFISNRETRLNFMPTPTALPTVTVILLTAIYTIQELPEINIAVAKCSFSVSCKANITPYMR